MERNEAEQVAAGIVNFYTFDVMDTWEKQYEPLNQIMTIASDLEWSNVLSSQHSWAIIKAYLDILDNIANHKFWTEADRARLGKIVIITQAINFWAECVAAKELSTQEAANRMVGIAGNEYFMHFYENDKLFAEVFDILCNYAVTGTSPWRPWKHVVTLIEVLQERYPNE
jgi:hypothetical protein